MAIVNPPGWLENAGPVHTAAQLRSYIGGMLGGTKAAATDLIPRGGVHPNLGGTASGGEFIVQAQSSPNMSIRVQPGIAAVPGAESPTQGVYMVMNDAELSISVTAAHGSLPRIDSVVIRIRDTDYSGANDDALCEVVAGTPASSPVPPTLTGNVIRLADIAVGAGVTSIVSGNITDRRTFYVANGGTLQVLTEAELATIGSASFGAGQPAWARQQGTFWILNNSGVWAQIPFGPTGLVTRVEKSGDTARTSTSFVDDPHLQQNGLPASAKFDYEIVLYPRSVSNNQGDIRFQFTHPAAGGAWISCMAHGLFNVPAANTSGPLDGLSLNHVTTSPTTPILNFACSADATGVLLKGTLFTGSGGGNFRLQWGLLTAVGTTTLLQDSYWKMIRV